jgi:hypothetical protein
VAAVGGMESIGGRHPSDDSRPDHIHAVARPNERTRRALRQGVDDRKKLFSPRRRAAMAAGVPERDVNSGGCFARVVRRVSVGLVLTAGVAGTYLSLTRALSGHCRKMAQILVQGRSPPTRMAMSNRTLVRTWDASL